MISLIPRLPCPLGEDSLVFKVGIFAYVNHVILEGRVGGVSQTNEYLGLYGDISLMFLFLVCF